MSRRQVDYDELGLTYNRHRREDPRLASRIHAGLGEARTVLNVGAGTGAYEPRDRWLLAIEPSATMRARRPIGAAPVIDARAEALPFDDGAVDAAMACATIHHWSPAAAGLAEMRRVARGPVVIFTLELACVPQWQCEYLAEGIASQQSLFPTIAEICDVLGGDVRVESVPTPGDCVDGFFEAFWRRPEALLDPAVRASQSMWSAVAPEVEQRMVDRLADGLASGRWDADHGHLRQQAQYDGSVRVIVSTPDPDESPCGAPHAARR
jgi:SAM-dependent methyltransferase